jgi:putative transposase
VIRAYRYRLLPNRTQGRTLRDWLEACRFLYNCALEQRREAWKTARKAISYNDQTKELTEIRAADPSWEAIPVEVSRSALRVLKRAFEGFFRRVKGGETPGYPRFRGRGRYQTLGLGRVPVEGKKVRVPKLGLVKFMKYRDLEGEIKDVRISFQAGRWWISFSCDLGKAPVKKPVATAVGIDLGLQSFAVLSDGFEIANPRYSRRSEERLVRRQQALSRKQKGSHSRMRAKLLVARAHEHVRNQRIDFSRKLAAELYRKYDLVAYEDLNIRGMARGLHAKSIQDAAWKVFIGALTDKAEWAGRWAVPVEPRGTSIRCSACGNDVQKTLSDRVHRCACGLIMDRDENAARNILALGRSAADVLGHSPPN